ncbi:TPA: hypothetical protein QCP80_003324 [Bacillus cereus]|nr:hypothetical protein [Bacillus cereus]
MNIKKELEENLKDINSAIHGWSSRDERATLYVAKSKTLLALQKYETNEEKTK